MLQPSVECFPIFQSSREGSDGLGQPFTLILVLGWMERVQFGD